MYDRRYKYSGDYTSLLFCLQCLFPQDVEEQAYQKVISPEILPDSHIALITSKMHHYLYYFICYVASSRC